MKSKTREDFGELLTVPGDGEHQAKYGKEVTVTKMGNVTLVHLDQPSQEELEERIDQVLEEVINDELNDFDDDDCPACRFARDTFYDIVFNEEGYSVIACKPPLWA